MSMGESKTVERNGNEVDMYSAEIIDAVVAAFRDVPNWNVVDTSSLAINRNRFFEIGPVHDTQPDGKVDSNVFEALRKTNLNIKGIHTGAKENVVRVWVETPENFFL